MGARHEVDLFTLADEAVDPAYRTGLGQHCRQITVARLSPGWARLRSLPFLFTRLPLTLPYFYSRELAAEIRKAMQSLSYDRIFVYCSAMAQYVEDPGGIPSIVDLVDVDSDKWLQYATRTSFPFSAIYRREGIRLREYERTICNKFFRVLVSTEREAQLLRQFSGTAPVSVIRNGVDVHYFDPARILPDGTTPAVVFTGDMSYFPNQDAVTFFAQKVFPLIQPSVPNVRFLIVGREPSRKVRQLQQIPGIEVTGFVPDVRTYLAKAQVAVAPFSMAAGIQNKILEAMAYGLPVVASSRAVQGLSKDVAGLIETADTAEELAAKVIRLLRDPELAQRTGLNGRRSVTTAYDWDQSLDELLQLLENPANGATPKAGASSLSCQALP
jgi:sugar transferase (PEP-CTERM/EpsH1 system associated)